MSIPYRPVWCTQYVIDPARFMQQNEKNWTVVSVYTVNVLNFDVAEFTVVNTKRSYWENMKIWKLEFEALICFFVKMFGHNF